MVTSPENASDGAPRRPRSGAGGCRRTWCRPRPGRRRARRITLPDADEAETPRPPCRCGCRPRRSTPAPRRRSGCATSPEALWASTLLAPLDRDVRRRRVAARSRSPQVAAEVDLGAGDVDRHVRRDGGRRARPLALPPRANQPDGARTCHGVAELGDLELVRARRRRRRTSTVPGGAALCTCRPSRCLMSLTPPADRLLTAKRSSAQPHSSNALGDPAPGLGALLGSLCRAPLPRR